MRDWFEALAPRERVFVTVAFVFVGFALAWFGVWRPLDARHENVTQSVDDWREGLAAIRPMKGLVQASAQGTATSPAPTQSLVVIIDNSLRQRGLYNALQRSQPAQTGDGIRVEFEQAAFDDLMLWLGDLHRQFGLKVEAGSFSVAASDSPGRVNSTVTLRR
jgi:general secretion pathway protein M